MQGKQRIAIFLVIILSIVGLWYVKNSDNKEVQKQNEEVDVISMAAPKVKDIEKQKSIEGIPDLYVTSFNIEAYKELDMPIMMHFGASWCEPCKRMKPYIEDLYDEYYGKMLIVYIDVDKVDIQNYPISVVPTQFFFNSDGTPFTPSEGVVANEKYAWIPYYTQDTDEHMFTVHQGLLTKQMLIDIFSEMGVER